MGWGLQWLMGCDTLLGLEQYYWLGLVMGDECIKPNSKNASLPSIFTPGRKAKEEKKERKGEARALRICACTF